MPSLGDFDSQDPLPQNLPYVAHSIARTTLGTLQVISPNSLHSSVCTKERQVTARFRGPNHVRSTFSGHLTTTDPVMPQE